MSNRPSPLESIEGIDLPEALARVGGKEDTLRTVLSIFAKSRRDMAQEIREAIIEGDFGTARRHIHTLIGVAANVSAKQVHRKARSVQSAINSGAPQDEILSRIMRLEDALRVVTSACLKLDEAPMSPNPAPATRSTHTKRQFQAQLAELEEQLERQSTSARKSLSALQGALSGVEDLREPLAKMAQDLQLFRFDLVKERLKSLKAQILSISEE